MHVKVGCGWGSSSRTRGDGSAVVGILSLLQLLVLVVMMVVLVRQLLELLLLMMLQLLVLLLLILRLLVQVELAVGVVNLGWGWFWHEAVLCVLLLRGQEGHGGARAIGEDCVRSEDGVTVVLQVCWVACGGSISRRCREGSLCHGSMSLAAAAVLFESVLDDDGPVGDVLSIHRRQRGIRRVKVCILDKPIAFGRAAAASGGVGVATIRATAHDVGRVDERPKGGKRVVEEFFVDNVSEVADKEVCADVAGAAVCGGGLLQAEGPPKEGDHVEYLCGVGGVALGAEFAKPIAVVAAGDAVARDVDVAHGAGLGHELPQQVVADALLELAHVHGRLGVAVGGVDVAAASDPTTAAAASDTGAGAAHCGRCHSATRTSNRISHRPNSNALSITLRWFSRLTGSIVLPIVISSSPHSMRYCSAVTQTTNKMAVLSQPIIPIVL
jgi:hypothetical protein